ncbi:TATA element modulatory factor 1 TATA binding-domain-containing protein [Scheffersomyces amazonensis]|uniref:TATA element modulatory factor 1 TATA binding-domain-containing protein n=1 Tax=Scheffersomyces amazonensis TaxID=1078765 RepID=UPI00315CEB87
MAKKKNRGNSKPAGVPIPEEIVSEDSISSIPDTVPADSPDQDDTTRDSEEPQANENNIESTNKNDQPSDGVDAQHENQSEPGLSIESSIDQKLEEPLVETESRELTPDPLETPVAETPPAETPVPTSTGKKRLTLQERLALAAKGKGKGKKIKSNVTSHEDLTVLSTPSLTPSTSNDPEVVLDKSPRANNNEEIKQNTNNNASQSLEEELNQLKAKNEELESRIRILAKPKLIRTESNQTFEKEKQELLAKLDAKEETIKQLLAEGEALSMKELKLNDTIKKLKMTNSELESSLLSYSEKNEETSLVLGELEDFLKIHKFKSALHLMEEHIKVTQSLEEAQNALEKELGMSWESKYKEQQTLYQEELSAKKRSLKDFNELKIQFDMYKKQHDLELESKDDLIKDLRNEISHIKSNNLKEIGRLEDKIELLRIESESSRNGQVEKSKNNSNQALNESDKSHSKSIDYEEFVSLSQTHHQLQQQFLNSQENWKVIESNLLSKVDNLSSSVDSLQRSKQKLSLELQKMGRIITNKDEEINKFTDSYKSAIKEKEEIKFSMQMKDNELIELQDKFDKLKEVFNTDRANLTAKIKSLTESLERVQVLTTSDPQVSLSNKRFNGNGLSINLDNRTPTMRTTSSHSISDIPYNPSWQDIRLGESSATPAIPKEFNFHNNSDTSLDESFDNITEDNFFTNSRYPSQAINTTNSHTGGGVGGASGSITASIPTGSVGNNIQLINKMSSNIRRLEIELNTLREENNSLVISKDKAEQDMLHSLKFRDEIDTLNDKIKALEKDIDYRNQKEQTMLELIGEKSEQVEELRADVQDLKELCKLQVQQLIDFQDSK